MMTYQKCHPVIPGIVFLLLCCIPASGIQPDILQKLENDMQVILNTRVCRESVIGVMIQDLNSGRILYQNQADIPLQPASNQKILTTIGALGLLTPEYKFKTSIHYSGELVNGLVTGDLYFVGGGDPFLVMEELWKIADRVSAMGIRHVSGNLIIDGTFFDDSGYPDDDWGRISMPLWYNAPTGGAASNFNAISVLATPGQKLGDPVKITVDPPLYYFTLHSSAVTSRARSRITLVLDLKEQHDSCDIIMKGALPIDTRTQTYYRHLTSSDQFTGYTFQYLLNEKGIIIDGRVMRGKKTEHCSLLYEHESRPLSELLITANKYSNNFMTEQIVKTIAAETCNCPGSTNLGMSIIKKYFENELKIDTNGMILSDGSGLSRRNRITARQFCEILRTTINESWFGPEFLVNQPIAGVDGTMKRRLNEHSEKRYVRAKTGSINNVVCLTGLIDGRRGRGLVFSILINKNRGRHGESRQAQDRMLEAMLDYWKAVNT
jgi:serine-type D-Ala-D-Ala carboxypeptidase/endopeptidase (penicillin-binding protein 4)